MILTFYSYKGGVGRSMALANVADILARGGLRVLMIDFDLEAPGLEQYFSVSQQARRQQGLLDLLLSYKQSMSVSAAGDRGDQPFMRLEQFFILPIYDQLPGGGRLDLLPAGQREGEDQLARYALNLRTFDWQDFYFNWAGDVFFEWLRRALIPKRYDIVLVDSRTGVTEMGGICAYQLADVVVVLCASNHQNVEGTQSIVRNFFSAHVLERRQNRPLQVIVVPARIEQHEPGELVEFRDRFDQAFGAYVPPPIQTSGTTFWDLLIPYEPLYAFEERIIAQPQRAQERQRMATAFDRLVDAIGSLAPPDTPLQRFYQGRVGHNQNRTPVIETQYDPTQRLAGYDVFLSYIEDDRAAAESIRDRLLRAGLTIFDLPTEPQLDPTSAAVTGIQRALEQSRAILLLLGASGQAAWQNEVLRAMFEERTRAANIPCAAILLPGTPTPKFASLPRFIAERQWVDLRKSLDDEAGFERLIAVLTDQQAGKPAPRAAVEHGAPFMGLNPFGEQDASLFFGRNQQVAQLVERARDDRFIALLGPSGSGKSSLVRAGLIPALRSGALPGSSHWRYLAMRPGPHPVDALAAVLGAASHAGFTDSLSLARALTRDEGALLGTSDLLLGDREDARIVLVIDQFEELWTLVPDEVARASFIRLLLVAIQTAETPWQIIISMRSDFLNRAAEYSDLASMIGDHIVLLGPMSTEQLRQAITRPIELVGMGFEPGLVEALIDEVADQSGALPLLQYTLLELWKTQRHGLLTWADYQSLGGIKGALAARADAILAQYYPVDAQRRQLRAILLRLVQPGEDTSDTRRQVRLDEVAPVGSSVEQIQALLKPLADERLITTGRDETGAETVEFSHEALIRAWPTLQHWIQETRESLRLQLKIEEAAREWLAGGESPDFLWTGVRLANVEAWLDREQPLLNERVQRFIAAASAERAAAELRQLKQLREFEQLLDARRTAIEELQTTIQAASLMCSPDAQSIFAVYGNGKARMLRPNGKMIFHDNRGVVTCASFSPDARLIAIGDTNGAIQLRRVSNGRLQHELTHAGAVRRVAWSPDGQFVASSSDDGIARLWDTSTGRETLRLRSDNRSIVSVAMSPDARQVIGSCSDGTVLMWDSRSGQLLTQAS
jgi:cellulose biosynthesis protein BcsQ